MNTIKFFYFLLFFVFIASTSKTSMDTSLDEDNTSAAPRAVVYTALSGDDLRLENLFTELFNPTGNPRAVAGFQLYNLESLFAASQGASAYQALKPFMVFERPVILTEAVSSHCWHGRMWGTLSSLLQSGEPQAVQLALYPTLWAERVRFIPILASRPCTGQEEEALPSQLDALASMEELECVVNLISPFNNPSSICEGMNLRLRNYAGYMEREFGVIRSRLLPYYIGYPTVSKLEERAAVMPPADVLAFLEGISDHFLRLLESPAASAKRSVERRIEIAETLRKFHYYFGARKLFDEGDCWRHPTVSAEMLYEFGLLNYKGTAGSKNFGAAFNYFQSAADLGHANAAFQLGILYYLGQGVEANLPMARTYYERAADLGNADAAFQLAKMFDEGVGTVQDNVMARTCYRWAAELGSAKGAFSYALMCELGEGADENLEEARSYFKKAADLNDRDGAFKFAQMCEKGQGGPEDLALARVYYQKAADRNLSEAAIRLALMCEEGRGGPQDPAMARHYYRKAADLESALGAALYAAMCEHGIGGEENLPVSRNYYQKAADLGNAEAALNFANMCAYGTGGIIDLPTARVYYKHSADLGEAHAACKFANMCEDGHGGEADMELAKIYYHQAVEGNDVEAAFNLGQIYDGELDLVRSRIYYKLAADLGDALGALNFAIMCERGEGGPIDLALARIYYQEALEGGESIAREKLRQLEASLAHDQAV